MLSRDHGLLAMRWHKMMQNAAAKLAAFRSRDGKISLDQAENFGAEAVSVAAKLDKKNCSMLVFKEQLRIYHQSKKLGPKTRVFP